MGLVLLSLNGTRRERVRDGVRRGRRVIAPGAFLATGGEIKRSGVGYMVRQVLLGIKIKKVFGDLGGRKRREGGALGASGERSYQQHKGEAERAGMFLERDLAPEGLRAIADCGCGCVGAIYYVCLGTFLRETEGEREPLGGRWIETGPNSPSRELECSKACTARRLQLPILVFFSGPGKNPRACCSLLLFPSDRRLKPGCFETWTARETMHMRVATST